MLFRMSRSMLGLTSTMWNSSYTSYLHAIIDCYMPKSQSSEVNNKPQHIAVIR